MNSSKLEILLAEDNVPDVNLVRHALRLHHVECCLNVCGDGEKALSFIDSRKDNAGPGIDLVLFDMNLPKFGGPEILQYLRSTPRFEETPAILMTSLDMRFVTTKVLSDKHLVYFNKPSSLDAFLELGLVVTQVLNKAQTRIITDS